MCRAGQEESGFLSVLPPAVSPAYPEGPGLKVVGGGVKLWPCWERFAVSSPGICPRSQTHLWSAVAYGSAGTVTTLELWLLTQKGVSVFLWTPLSDRLIRGSNLSKAQSHFHVAFWSPGISQERYFCGNSWIKTSNVGFLDFTGIRSRISLDERERK